MEQRKKNRLGGYDYSRPGVYFITLCTKNREPLFWDMSEKISVGADIIRPESAETDRIPLSAIGQMVDCAIQNIKNIYSGVVVDKYVIMPNHVHMILILGQGRMISAPTVSTIIGGMERWSSRQCGRSIWQKDFHDHIIRSEEDYLNIWNYIDTNPAKWADDCYYEEV